jgi:hypothetical protein
MWSEYGGKNLKDRAWMRKEEEGVTSFVGFFSATTWLEKRLEEIL